MTEKIPDIYVDEQTLQKVDDLTPKYKAIMDSLSAKQRRVLASLLTFGCPVVITRQIALRARIDVHSTSVHLGRLEKTGQ